MKFFNIFKKKRKAQPEVFDCALVLWFLDGKTDELTISLQSLESWMKSKSQHERYSYNYIASRLGKDVFVFDIEACEFLEGRECGKQKAM